MADSHGLAHGARDERSCFDEAPECASSFGHGGALDAPRMLAWLRSKATQPDGHVLSWVNAAHPGYHYPEVAGLLLTLLATREAAPSVTRTRIASQLARGLAPSGAVGRGGIDYAFDSAMALRGLHAHLGAGGALDADPAPTESVTERLFSFIADCVARRSALGAGDEVSGPRWSTSYGCHLLKMTHALGAHGRLAGARSAEILSNELLVTFRPLARAGRFVIHEGSEKSYVHAACYALEGLLALREVDGTRQLLMDGARWLASLQRPDGALPAWHDGVCPRGPWPTDVVAQSVRLWAAMDPVRFAPEIHRGLRRLAELQAPCGGLRYLEGSNDINSWATIFAVQAVTWAEDGATPNTLA